MTTFTKITAGVLAGAAMVAAASPADAQYRGYRHYRGGGDRTALAVGAGVLGLAVGAALSSRDRGYYGNRGYYDGYYGRPYAYNSGGYGGYGGYYGSPYGYDGGYYRAPRARCWTERQWDDWRGRWHRVRVCNRYR